MIRFGKRLAKKTPFSEGRDGMSERAWWDVQHAIHEQTIANLNEEIENKDAVIVDLQGDLDETQAELWKIKRLSSYEFHYDKNAVSGFTAETASNAVGIASRLLDAECRIPFGVACAVVLKRKLDEANKQIEELTERQANRPALKDNGFANFCVSPIASWRVENSVFAKKNIENADPLDARAKRTH